MTGRRSARPSKSWSVSTPVPDREAEAVPKGHDERLGGGDYSLPGVNGAVVDGRRRLLDALHQVRPDLLDSLRDNIFWTYRALFFLPFDPTPPSYLAFNVPAPATSFEALSLLADAGTGAGLLRGALVRWADDHGLPHVPWFFDAALETLLKWQRQSWPDLPKPHPDDRWSPPSATTPYDPLDGDFFLGGELQLTFSLDSWDLLDETDAVGRDRLIAEATKRIDAHIAKRHHAAQALGLRRNPGKRPPRSPSRDHFVWAARVLFLGQSGADVARAVGVDPKAVNKAVAEIKKVVAWPDD